MAQTTPVARGPIVDGFPADKRGVARWEVGEEFDGVEMERARLRESVGVADLSHLPKFQVIGAGVRDLVGHQASGNSSGEPRRPGQCWFCRAPWAAAYRPGEVLCSWLADDLIRFIWFGDATEGQPDITGIVGRGAGFQPAEVDQGTGGQAGSSPHGQLPWNSFLPPGVLVLDVTGHFAVLELIGPQAAAVLQQLTSLDVSARSLPPGSCAETGVARVPATVIRVESAGPPRFQLWCSREYGQYLWQTVLESARPLGGGPVGSRALDGATAGFS